MALTMERSSTKGGWLEHFGSAYSQLAAILVFSVSLTACASNEIKWAEEVKLSDGRVIQVQRRIELTESGFPVQQRGFIRYHELCYAPMNIRWKSKPGYQPDIFDVVDGKAYMHVPLFDCFKCMLQGYPETDALYFVWDDGQWKRITHREFPAKSEWNLLMSLVAPAGHEKDDPRGLLSLEDKQGRSSSLRLEQKKQGWKRINESGKGIGRCNVCRTQKTTTDETPEIFINDGRSACQP